MAEKAVNDAQKWLINTIEKAKVNMLLCEPEALQTFIDPWAQFSTKEPFGMHIRRYKQGARGSQAVGNYASRSRQHGQRGQGRQGGVAQPGEGS
jgi:hypothetical protein